MPGYKKGGEVKETGMAMVHKGEHVVPKKAMKGHAEVMKGMKSFLKEEAKEHKGLMKGK